MTYTMYHRLLAILIGLLLLPYPTWALGGAVFSPSASSPVAKVGERFSVDVLLDPHGEKIDTARVLVTFPPDLVRVEAVTLGTLLPRQSPGNSFDNAAGTISEGGFLLGGTVSSPGLPSEAPSGAKAGTFATITFDAVKSGSATISISGTSRLIANGEEKGTGSYGSVVVNIQAEDDADAPSIELISLSHPSQDDWYATNSFVADWTKPDMGTVTGWLTAFDRSATTDPAEKLSIKYLTKTVEDISDGTWYFHLKGVLAEGTFTETVHYRVQVDQTPPNPIAPTTPRTRYLEGESALLTFGTTDETSGIDHYEVAFNDEAYETATSPMVLKDLKIGDAFVQVKAVDRAGNATFGKTGFRVYSKDTILSAEDTAARDKEQGDIANLRPHPDPLLLKERGSTLAIISGLAVLAGAGILAALNRNKRKFISKK